MRIIRPLARFDRMEVAVCRFFNQQAQRRPVRHSFALVSRLGDGLFWYALMGTLMLFEGLQGSVVALQMGTTALVGVVVYKVLKGTLVRERPFISHGGIRCAAAPLDRYSFPSGHTLQAVLFSTVAMAWFPALAVPLLGFVMLVALSRVVLGLHYPSDVLVGALIGYGLARLSLWLYPATPAIQLLN
ncbi:undecaprenyl-diphosphatase [Alkalispirillum mobile]|uniref:undecaprenyl-diphosphate phosphatase n=1 Tax=Alkalispirillum mobile TaxID=85925 RepID=A0A498C5I2_9GAMM|nr:phosphatase PAP2 family protein [Alkalispirillum mobile]RLK50543.1 undecaprenyl-diphosphatase [Alkalispirillum mobile]